MKEQLRHVRLEFGYTLKTFALYPCRWASTGQEQIGYEFCDPSGAVLFAGEDFGCSPMHAIDSDACLRNLLGFLTLRKGDTDADYFADYTPEQLAFSQSSECEYLKMYGLDDWGRGQVCLPGEIKGRTLRTLYAYALIDAEDGRTYEARIALVPV